MSWQTFAFIIVAGTAFGFSFYRFFQLWRLIRGQKGSVPRLSQLKKELPTRIAITLVNVFGQKAVMRKPIIGIIHATIFWGFLFISLGTIEQFLSTLHSSWNYEFIGPTAYSVYLFLHDIFTFLVMVAVAGAAYRRYIVRPPGVGKSTDATFVLLFTFLLMVSLVFMHGAHIAELKLLTGQGVSLSPIQETSLTSLPFSGMVSNVLLGLGLEANSYLILSGVFKWIHILLVLGFSVYIPGSKHLHIVAAGPNTFLKALKTEKAMTPIRFEDESITQYGAAKITDLSWKDTLDYYACTECGRCQDVCPAYNTQKPLSPKMLIIDLKENLYRNKTAVATGNVEAVTPLVDKNITEDVLWACTSCRACEIACPVFIEHTDKIYAARRNLVMMESKFPAEVQTVFKNMETNASPWAFSSEDRMKWAEGLSVKTLADGGEVDVLLWVGCAGAFDERNKKVIRSFVNLLKKANVKFAVLGKEESCTGDPARRIGNEYLFQTLAQSNIETLNRYKVKHVVTSCPHCFNTLKNEYPDFGGNYTVEHHTQFLGRLIKEGKLKPSKTIDESVTYHDSCYLGRWNDEYSSPRQLLTSIPAIRPVEMEANKEKSMCCGAGGGRMWMEETIGKRINVTRTEQALQTKAGIVASACPFCMTMMTDGLKSKEMQDKVKVVDLAELMDQATS